MVPALGRDPVCSHVHAVKSQTLETEEIYLMIENSLLLKEGGLHEKLGKDYKWFWHPMEQPVEMHVVIENYL